jgi:hypothetical protein
VTVKLTYEQKSDMSPREANVVLCPACGCEASDAVMPCPTCVPSICAELEEYDAFLLRQRVEAAHAEALLENLENPCEVCGEREGYTVIDEPICESCYHRKADRARDRAKENGL